MAQTKVSRAEQLKMAIQEHIAGGPDYKLRLALAKNQCDMNTDILDGLNLRVAAIAWLYNRTKARDSQAIDWVIEYSRVPGYDKFLNSIIMPGGSSQLGGSIW